MNKSTKFWADFVVALLQGLLSKPLPALWTIDALGSFHCNIKVSAFDGKLEPRVGVLNEVQSDLRTEFRTKRRSI